MASLLPGTEVLARGLRWEVVSVLPAGDQELHRLRCLDGALRGEECDFLIPLETLEPLTQELDPARAARLAHWRVYHQAFLLEQALGPTALLAAQPGRLKLAPYQLVPVMRALQMSRPRLLLADGVGLGKTVEAGLVLAELIARRRAHRILLVTPAGPLLQQWRREMRERFGLRFRVLDRDSLQDIRYATELGANPFDHEALGLISIDFAKQEKVLQDLERTHYDVAVIDEAHHCAALGTAGEQEDSQRRRLAEVLARRADGLLLLTATPHDGYDAHFASLMELLDPSLVDGRGALRGEAFRRHVVRRLKRHIKDPQTGADLFPERNVLPIDVGFTAATHPRFVAFQEAILALVAPRLRQALKQRRYGEVLAFVALLKRSVSTALACRRTLQTISERLGALAAQGTEEQEARRQRLRTLRDYRRRLERFGALSFEEEQDQALLEAEDMAAELAQSGADELLEKLEATRREARRGREALRRVEEVRAALADLAALAEQAETEDPKLAAVMAELRAIRAAEPGANVLVYTEYTDSQEALLAHLAAARARGELSGEVLAISGEDDEARREEATLRFSSEDNLVLVSTDATAEGLNLHARCHHLLHLELPYNPNRLEQRNGRIDRFGQLHPPVVRYLYLAGTFEERLLRRLVSKFERQRQVLSFVPNTLGVLANESSPATVRLLEGLADEQGRLFERPERPLAFGEEQEDTTSQAYRELLGEIDRAFSGFEKAARTFDWLGGAGLAADERLLHEAEEARERAGRLGVADLSDFVLEALRVDSADPQAVQRSEGGTWELKLPPAWTHGLEDVPGYEPARRALLLTAELEREKDAQGRRVGFLGRAHPIVRRALDRVRNVQFGTTDGALDRRVSAARGEGTEPELLLTFLGRVESGAGRELERVLAVRVARDGALTPLANAADWEHLAAPERAVPTAGVWERHFRSWASGKQEAARGAALRGFEALAREHGARHEESLAAERTVLTQWLKTRADELCGARRAVQAQLFDTAPGSDDAPWQALEQDTDRLAAFATASAPPPRARREAELVLELYRRRLADLERRGRLSPPLVSPIGMLMLVPALEG